MACPAPSRSTWCKWKGTICRTAWEGLMHRALESRGFISAILAMAAGSFLFYRHPFPDEQIFLHVIAMRAPQVFLIFTSIYYVFLFPTPSLMPSPPLSA